MTQSIRSATPPASVGLPVSRTSLYYLFTPPEIVDEILHPDRVAEEPTPPPLIDEIAQKLLLWPTKSLKLEIERIQEPDSVILAQIHLHEKTPGALWCALLERSIKAPGLRKWLLENIDIVWLSREDAIGRACRILLQNAFNESIFLTWIHTKPPQSVLMQFFQDRTIRKKRLSDDSLQHLSKLPLDYLAAQSLTHFPWERIKDQWEEKKLSWLDALKKSMLECPSIPEGLKALCSLAKSPKAQYTLLCIVGVHSEESFLTESMRLTRALCNDHKGISLSTSLLQGLIEKILKIERPSASLLQECIYLLLHPFCKSLNEDRVRLFDLLSQKVIGLFFNTSILGGASLHIYACMNHCFKDHDLNLSGSPKKPLELSSNFEISAETILERAKALCLHYLHLDPAFSEDMIQKQWNRFTTPLSPLTIHFPFEGSEHLPLLKSYLKRLCQAKHDYSPLHWIFSLFTMNHLHKFAINYPKEAAFTAEMVTEVFFNGHFQRDYDHVIMVKAFFNFAKERPVKIPDLERIKSIFLNNLSLSSEADCQAVHKVILRLIDNGCIGAINEADQILQSYADQLPPDVKAECEQTLNLHIWKYLDLTLDDPQDVANFSNQYPHLIIRSVDQMMNLEGIKRLNSLKGFLLFLTKEIKAENGPSLNDSLQNLIILGNCLKKFVRHYYFDEILPELKIALGAYSETLINRMENIWEVYENFLLQDYIKQLLDQASSALNHFNLHLSCPIHYRLLWNKLLIFHFRKLLRTEQPSIQEIRSLLKFYDKTHIEAFQTLDYLELHLYANQVKHLNNNLPHLILERHRVFFIQAGLYAEHFFDVIISTLDEPDDLLFDRILETEKNPSFYMLELLKRIRDVKTPALDRWLLSKTPTDWFFRGDEIGTLLRSILNRAPQETHLSILGTLLAAENHSPKADQLLQIFSSQRIYPNALLETLLSILKSIKCAEDQKEQWIAIFLNQDLSFFPWDWAVKNATLQKIAKKVMKNGYLPQTLEKRLQSIPQFADAFFPSLVGSAFSSHLNLIQPWIERVLLNKKVKPDHALIEKHVKALLEASLLDQHHLKQAATLILHPLLSKLPHLNDLFSLLVDYSLRFLFEGSDQFAEKASQFKELANEFPNAKYCEDPIIVEGFSFRPSTTLSMKSIFQAADAILLHYLDFVLFFDEKTLKSTQEKLEILKQDLQDDGISLNFDVRLHEPLHWLFIEKLLCYPVKNEAERSVLALFARVQLHEYALNHRKDLKRLLNANDRIFFMSDFQNHGSFWLEQVAYSMFADEKRIALNDRPRRMLIQSLIESDLETLRSKITTHSKPIHDFFMGLIQASTPASLEVVERIRTELCIEPHHDYWAQERVETEKAFCATILPLLEKMSNFSLFFSSKPYLLRFTFSLLENQPERITEKVREGLLDLMMHNLESLNPQKPRYLIELWQADPQITGDQRFITTLLICAEKLRQSIDDCYSSGEVPECYKIFPLLTKPPLPIASPVLYRRLWHAMHEWMLVRMLSVPVRKQKIWIHQLQNLIQTANREAILSGQDSLVPYLTNVLNRITNSPPLNDYHQMITQLMK